MKERSIRMNDALERVKGHRLEEIAQGFKREVDSVCEIARAQDLVRTIGFLADADGKLAFWIFFRKSSFQITHGEEKWNFKGIKLFDSVEDLGNTGFFALVSPRGDKFDHLRLLYVRKQIDNKIFAREWIFNYQDVIDYTAEPDCLLSIIKKGESYSELDEMLLKHSPKELTREKLLADITKKITAESIAIHNTRNI